MYGWQLTRLFFPPPSDLQGDLCPSMKEVLFGTFVASLDERRAIVECAKEDQLGMDLKISVN